MEQRPQHDGSMSRRKFIEWAGRGLAVGAIGAPLLLEACTPSTSAPATSAPAKPAAPAGATAAPAGAGAPASSGGAMIGSLRLPTQVAFEGPKPDLPGSTEGLDPAFFKFPTNLVKSVSQPPGDGSTISAFLYLTLAAPPAMAQNAAWQAVNKAINATLNMEMVTGADYPAKVNVTIAGNKKHWSVTSTVRNVGIPTSGT